MKSKYFAIALALIALFMIIPAASSASVDDSNMTVNGSSSLDGVNLTIPEGFWIKNSTDNFILLEGEDHQSISISIINDSTSVETLKFMLQSYDYNIMRSEVYHKGNFSIEEDFYTQEYQSGIIYFCDDGNELIVIDYKTVLSSDIVDSPAEPMVDELCGV